MKRIQTIISVGALAASSVLFSNIACAQSAATKDASQGSLGKRYAFANFAVGKPEKMTGNIYGTAVGVYLPVTGYLDVAGGYGYSRQKTKHSMAYFDFDTKAHAVGTDFIFYKKVSTGLKPFASVGLGYTWVKAVVDGNLPYIGYMRQELRNDYASWNVAVGLEIPFRWLSLTPAITYADDFQKSYESGQTWNYSLEASTWITPQIGVYADIAYSDPKHLSGDYYMMSYGAGVRFTF